MYIANNLKENLSYNMKALRRRHKKTLDGWADELGIARSTLQEVESGRSNTRLDTLEVIAKGLNISAQQLIAPPGNMQRQNTEYGLLEQLNILLKFDEDQRQEFAECFRRIVDLLQSLDG